MLILIGTGISFDLTLSAIDELKKCDEIYIESYTNLIENENISTLEKLINKKIISLERSQVESKFLIEQAKNSNVALLVSGDPLIATTHISLIIDAEKARIKKIIILSRIGENNEKIIYNEIEKLKITPLGKPPFVIIIPGKLHMVEEEYLQQL